jgi:ferredoxin
MRVWIDQAKCQNSGLCEETEPALFKIGNDFLAYVKQDGVVLLPGGEACHAVVPGNLEDAAEEAARECPSQCIHLVDD